MITDAGVEKYLQALIPRSAPVLAEMEEQARQRDIPIVGPVVARLLHLLAQLSGARRVFELGSAIGYSTLWWADAVGDEGEVYYTDSSPENAAEAAMYFQRAELQSRIHVLEGEALSLLENTPGSFDMIFCDLNKEQYPQALREAVPRIRPGGLFVADNVLWRGEVAGFQTRGGEPLGSTAAVMAEFNRLVYADHRLYPVVLPLRDGVTVARVQPL